MGVAYNADGIDEDGHYDETKDRNFLKRLKKEYPEVYQELIKTKISNVDIKYENLTDKQKEKLKDIALSLGYRIDDSI